MHILLVRQENYILVLSTQHTLPIKHTLNANPISLYTKIGFKTYNNRLNPLQ